MTTIVYPDPALSRAWAVAQYDEGVQWDVEITTSRNGRVYTQALPGARWKATLAWDADSVAHLTQRRQLEALLMSLRGGANRLQVWHLLTPQPLGTLRGLPVVASSAAAGATSIAISGAAGADGNRLVNAGFELDSDVDGLADGWTAFAAGSHGSVTYGAGTVYGGSRAQRITAAALGTSGGDQAGLYSVVQVAGQAGQPYCYAMTLLGGGAAAFSAVLYVQFVDASNTVLATHSTTVSPSLSVYGQFYLANTVPAGADRAVCYVWATARSGSAGLSALNCDNAMFQVGVSTPQDFATVTQAPTVLRGDRLQLGIGGQRVMATADATADAGGNLTLTFEPQLRAAVSAAAAVVWDKPTSTYVLDSPELNFPSRGGLLPGLAVNLVEAW